MRVIINAFSAVSGGGATYIDNIIQHYSERKHLLIVLCSTQNYAMLAAYSSYRVRVVQIPFLTHIIKRILYENFFLNCFIKQVKATHYFTPSGHLPLLLTRKVKSICVFSNMLPFSPNAIRQYPLCSRYRLKLRLQRYLLLFSFIRADGIVFLSNYAKNTIASILPSVCKKSTTINNGCSAYFHLTTPPDLSSNSFVYVSTINVYKSHLELVKAWNILKNRYKLPFKLHIVGHANPRYLKRVQAYIKAYQLEKYIYIHGAASHPEMLTLYESCRGIIFASQCENCPIILQEAMATGRLIFSSNYDPMPEIGRDSVIYFDPKNPDDIASKIAAIDDYNYSELTKVAKVYANAYDWNATTQALFSFIQKT